MFPKEEVHKIFELGHFFPPHKEVLLNEVNILYQGTCSVCGMVREMGRHSSGPLKGKWYSTWFLPAKQEFEEYTNLSLPLENPLTCDEAIVKDILE